MNPMRYLIIALFSVFCFQISAQQTRYHQYTWSTFQQVMVPDTAKSENGAVQSLERRITEVYANENGTYEEISVFHSQVKVETHEAINRENKIYVRLKDVIELIDLKARFISPTGVVTELPKESIRVIENLENKGDFKTFAIEGAEIGGTIEYYYVLRKTFNFYGTYWIQGKEPRYNADVIYLFPASLEYQIKSYNGFAAFEKTELDNDYVQLRAQQTFIPAVSEEKYAFYKANLMRYEVSMTYNLKHSIMRLFSFGKANVWYYNDMAVANKVELKAISGLTKKIDPKSSSLEVRVRAIENWVKSNIAIRDEVPRQTLDLIIKNKQCHPRQAVALMFQIYQTAEIPCQVVATCDHSERSFDVDFSCWNFLDDTFLFFPSLNKALKPDDTSTRLGVIPGGYIGAYGLFFTPVRIDDKTRSFGYDIAQLPSETYHANMDSMIIKAEVDVAGMALNAKFHRVMCGQIGANFQSFWGLLNKERQDDIVKQMFKMGTENVQINNYKIQNKDAFLIGQKPFVWDVDVTGTALIEQAGNDLVVRIGETIGEQSELYQHQKRVHPVQLDVLRGYYRSIEFTIPAGYIIANMDDLNMRVEMTYENSVSCAFTSQATITGNTLTIVSHEYYGHYHYPSDHYEAFRQVINAAADFNKKTLVLKKM
jgi:hypothetical protein